MHLEKAPATRDAGNSYRVHVEDNCFDNAAIESFFGTLKAEYFRLAAPNSLETLEAGVHDYVHYYNHERIKLRLNGLSPVGYRLRNTA